MVVKSDDVIIIGEEEDEFLTLPDETCTADVDRFIREWGEFAAPLMNVTGMVLVAYGGGCEFEHLITGRRLDVSAWLIRKLNLHLPKVTFQEVLDRLQTEKFKYDREREDEYVLLWAKYASTFK